MADFGDETVVLTEGNRAIAAIVPLRNVDRESLALSHHPGFLDLIARSRSEFAAGRTLSPRKMHYELLGNTVAHLHWHLFPRYADDPNPTRPIWEHTHVAKEVSEAEYARTVEAIQRHLG